MYLAMRMNYIFFSATFDRKDGSSISFAQYYKERYNIAISNMSQPMLISMPKDKDKRRGISEISFG